MNVNRAQNERATGAMVEVQAQREWAIYILAQLSMNRPELVSSIIFYSISMCSP